MILSFLIAMLSITIVVLYAWLMFIITDNASIIDGFWALGSGILIAIYAWSAVPLSKPSLVVVILALLWSARLFFYLLFTRIIKGHVDPRYTRLSESWSGNRVFGFLKNYLIQGFLMLILTLPFLYISHSKLTFSWQSILGMGLSFLGLINEALSDWQLSRFKKRHKDKKEVCQKGWWQFSRHPNFFFDWLQWLGFAICAAQPGWSLLALLSPAVLLFIFLKVTIPLTEKQALSTRPEDYKLYMAKTSVFMPWLER